MRSAVVGLGETGKPLFEILSQHHEVDGIDLKDCKNPMPRNYEIINICLPYGENFVGIVQDYQDLFNPSLTIIHSTVPIGTTSKIRDAVHSPILGLHNRMKDDLKLYQKWIGGEKADEARRYLHAAGFKCLCVPKSEETEALKLMCLATYGMSIAMAQYRKEICDTYGFSYNDVVEWDANYNNNVAPWLKRPILSPPGERIKGHCVTQNTKILNEQHPNKILEEILKYA